MVVTKLMDESVAITITQLRSSVEERFSKLEEQVELNEKIAAQILMAYGEMAAMVQALLSMLVNEDDDEKRKEFFKHIKESRETMMSNMAYAKQQAEHSLDKFVAYSTGVAEGSLDPDNSQQ